MQADCYHSGNIRRNHIAVLYGKITGSFYRSHLEIRLGILNSTIFYSNAFDLTSNG